jgi:hypothetical protein
MSTILQQLKHLLLAIVVSGLVAFLFGFFIARSQFTPDAVTSETLLRAMQNEGFFVSQSVILEESITIDNRTGNALRDFFVSENIEASATVKVALGFDTTELLSEDIRLDGNTVQITVPPLRVFSVEVLGDVDIDTQRGIISRITAGEDDYNGLVATLKEQARATVTDPDIMTATQLGTIESLTQFLQFIAPKYTSVITFE